jgi:hypothetical protein
LTGFGYELGFSSILKYGVGAGNDDIDTHPESVPESAPHISNYVLPLLNYKPFNKILGYIYMFVFIFKLGIKQSWFAIYILCLKNNIVKTK